MSKSNKNLNKEFNNTYSIPDGMRVYAIGDIHGYLGALQAMHLKIDNHLYANPIDQAVIVYLGDYIDRGPESADVIERLCLSKQEDSDIERYFIKGNHEWGMMDFMDNPASVGAMYLKWGGLETLKSYGVEIPDNISQKSIIDGEVVPVEYEALSDEFKDKVPPHHISFLQDLELYKQIGGYLFVHAGVRPKIDLKKQNPQDLMRIREPFSGYEGDYGFKVVHGHQISTDIEITNNRIGIDTGFYEGGMLSCVALEQTSVETLQIKQNIEVTWTHPKNI